MKKVIGEKDAMNMVTASESALFKIKDFCEISVIFHEIEISKYEVKFRLFGFQTILHRLVQSENRFT